MIRLGKLTDYALVLMTQIARSRQPWQSARELAAESRLPLPTVTKLLKELQNKGLLISHLGVGGGYSLASGANQISVAEIVSALEGTIALTECSTEIAGLCGIEASCQIRSNMQVISGAVRGALESVMLSDLIRPMHLTSARSSRGEPLVSLGFASKRS